MRNCHAAIVAARRRLNQTSGVSVSRWRDQFLAGGRQVLEAGAGHGPSARERQLAAEIEQLNTALGEAHMELRVWKEGARCIGLRRTRRPPRGGGRNGHLVLRDRGDPAGDLVSVVVGVQFDRQTPITKPPDQKSASDS